MWNAASARKSVQYSVFLLLSMWLWKIGIKTSCLGFLPRVHFMQLGLKIFGIGKVGSWRDGVSKSTSLDVNVKSSSIF